MAPSFLLLLDLPTGQSVEAGLTPDEKETFEHLLGHGFRNSPVIKWMSTEFTKRVMGVV